MTATARIIKAADVQGLTPLAVPPPGAPARGFVLPREVAAAKAEAARVLEQAQRAATELHLQAAALGRADAVAELAARQMAFHERQLRGSQAQVQHSIALAKILAERLIGEALQLDDELVGRLAQQSLQQLRDRNALVVRAHPDDHPQISKQVALLGLKSVSLVADATLQRGELCLDSDLGQLELRVGPGLDRLIDRVRSLLHDDTATR
jgi:flagellar biosynthesis/type III secretory pathway protein FliH